MKKLAQPMFSGTVRLFTLFGTAALIGSFIAQPVALQAAEIIYNQIASMPRTDPVDTRTGSRSKSGNCPEVQPPLTAIVPIEGNKKYTVGGRTVSKYPSFWFYVPYSSASRVPLTFTLQDETGKPEIKSISVPRPENPSIVQVQIPESEQPLQVDKLYRWVLRADCSVRPVEVSGWIQRVKRPDALKSGGKASNSQQLAKLYDSLGLWYDALTELGKAQRSSGQPGSEWQSLLKKVELENIATFPIAPE